MKEQVNIRQATTDDSFIISQAVAMAIGDENAIQNYCGKDYIKLLTRIAENNKSQYSYRNALIAEIEGQAIGVAIGYNGAHLHELRSTTYSIIYNELKRTPSIPDETESGEFYIDTIAVLPEHRGKGVGRALVTAIRDKAFSEGHENVGLLVDYNNPQAESLYTSLGFTRIGTKIFLGHKMWHMQSTVNK